MWAGARAWVMTMPRRCAAWARCGSSAWPEPRCAGPRGSKSMGVAGGCQQQRSCWRAPRCVGVGGRRAGGLALPAAAACSRRALKPSNVLLTACHPFCSHRPACLPGVGRRPGLPARPVPPRVAQPCGAASQVGGGRWAAAGSLQGAGMHEHGRAAGARRRPHPASAAPCVACCRCCIAEVSHAPDPPLPAATPPWPRCCAACRCCVACAWSAAARRGTKLWLRWASM